MSRGSSKNTEVGVPALGLRSRSWEFGRGRGRNGHKDPWGGGFTILSNKNHEQADQPELAGSGPGL